MKRKDFDYVIKQFETTGRMGFCPDTFKAFAWESVKNIILIKLKQGIKP